MDPDELEPDWDNEIEYDFDDDRMDYNELQEEKAEIENERMLRMV